MPSLATLPAELISQVFLELTSLADVNALARTSSDFNRLFRNEKPRITVNVVRQAIHPTILPLAIVACTVSRTLDHNTLVSTVPYVENETWANAKYRETTLIENHESLLHLLRIIQSFVKDFTSQALIILDHHSNQSDNLPSKNKEIEDLSESELGRVQRAFIWFEIYRRILGGFDNRPKDDESLCTLISFHIPMTGAEISELYTVQEYLERLVEEVFYKIEQFAEVRAKEDKEAAAILTFSEELEEDSLTRVERDFRSSPGFPEPYVSVGDMFWNKSRISQSYKGSAAFLVELGLPFCRKFLFEMSLQQQMTAVRLALPHHRILSLRSMTLYNILSLVLGTGFNGAVSRKIEPNCHTECLYRDRAYLTSEPWDMFQLAQAYESRQAGCCFWSENRLRAKGFDPESHPNVIALSLLFAEKLNQFKTAPITFDYNAPHSLQPTLFEDDAGFRRYVTDCDYESNEVAYKFESRIERADSIG